MEEIKKFWKKFLILIYVIIVGVSIVYFTGNDEITDESYQEKEQITKEEINVKKGSLTREPIQMNISKRDPIKVSIGGISVKMTRLASYDIMGAVVGTKRYNDTIGPVDVGIAWGKLTKNDKYKTALSSINMANRYLSCVILAQTDDEIKEYTNLYSNNHLVPANENIRNKILSIKRDDYIRIKGYLVYLEWKVGNKKNEWGPSSLTRTDSGEGACEIIYVESIESW